MIIKSIKLNNYTVFESANIPFGTGINVLIGENATGKTHLMKVLYSACVSSRKDTDFGHKIVRTMLPDEYRLSRLITRKPGNHNASIYITGYDDKSNQKKILGIEFDNKTKRWEGKTKGKEPWEKAFNGDVSSFIPAKEMLSHSYQLTAAASVGNIHFDDTYIDVINSAKIDISLGKNNSNRATLIKKIEKITDGRVTYDSNKDEFYLHKGNMNLEFNLVAEGIKKAGLLWLLAKNGTLEKGSVLFWDEPESNINPAFISTIAELLLELESNGVQIFIATHDYFLAKYLDILSKQRGKTDHVIYYSLFRSKETGFVEYERAEEFTMLNNNPIIQTYLKIYRDEVLL